jgi:beta-N-acetylhexosaminidase
MTLGPLMVDVAGTVLGAEDRELLAHPAVGGVILFTRNCESPQQVRQLVDAIHAARDPHLLVAVDQEGGRVQRLRNGFTRLPPPGCLGALYDTDRTRAIHLAQTLGWLMAAEVRAVGIDLSFAPLLDLDHGVSAIIGNRALHKHPESVAALAQAYQSGMLEAGMAATGKHFPGHGAVAADSHLDLPVDPRLYEDIAQWDMVPFERMIHYGLAAVMMAHIVYSRVDANPAGFSRYWIKAVLRDTLGFQGAVFSDDLSMKGAAIAGSHTDRAALALEAGCDMVLVCNDRDNAAAVAESLEGYASPVSHLRLARLHGHVTPDLGELQHNPRWEQAVAAAGRCEAVPELDLGV